MSERHLPPELEEKARTVSFSAGSYSHIMLVSDLLDWLHGRDGPIAQAKGHRICEENMDAENERLREALERISGTLHYWNNAANASVMDEDIFGRIESLAHAALHPEIPGGEL